METREAYFSELLGSLVPTCFGVVGMEDTNAFQGIRSFFDRKHKYLDKGVAVRSVAGGLVIDLHIRVTYGINISTVVQNIVEKVRYTVENVTGMNVREVNVYVDSMIS
ncbi:MAG TPA: Asp23/Gls24 family envelope stress response protein [Clostridiales bacterium]|nr:Asp23/Gls24 family envelope stress response protein [Clostridiales bacterium]